ncbi:hypothetical protein [Pseudomonas sp. Marseille-Q5115]|uniref:hypothetical protein n=1 Tax=Pseudomonas sp. Marseille-Q5115 TaxID=2866593 RepID=UPI001CE4395F|nr:hypothetical protein [Pseudomonas sp. Marseille-Q5115]
MTSIQSTSADMMRWNALVANIESAAQQTDAVEMAAEARGYLRCLHDVGLISAFQRNRMATDLEDACARRTEKDFRLKRCAAVSRSY